MLAEQNRIQEEFFDQNLEDALPPGGAEEISENIQENLDENASVPTQVPVFSPPLAQLPQPQFLTPSPCPPVQIQISIPNYFSPSMTPQRHSQKVSKNFISARQLF